MLGARVTNKVMGPKVTGTVVLMAKASVYRTISQSLRECPTWDRLYPGWENGNLVVIHLDQPAKPLREDEVPAGASPSYEEIEEVESFVVPEGEVCLA